MVFGGTTTHVDFCFVRPGLTSQQVIETRARARWKGQLVRGLLLPRDAQGYLPIKLFDQLRRSSGLPSFKVFTVDVLPPHPKARPPLSARLRAHPAGDGEDRAAQRDHGGARRGPRHRAVHVRGVSRGGKQTDGWLLPLVHNKLSPSSWRSAARSSSAAYTSAGVCYVTSAREGVEGPSRSAQAAGATRSTRDGGCTSLRPCFNGRGLPRRPRGLCYHTYHVGSSIPRTRRRSGTGSCATASTAATDEFPASPLEVQAAPARTSVAVTGNSFRRRGADGDRLLRGRGEARSVARAVRGRHRRPTPLRVLGPYPREGRPRAPAATRTSRSSIPAIKKTLAKGRFPRRATAQPVGGAGRSRGWPVTADPARPRGGGESAHGRRPSRREARCRAQDLAGCCAPPGVLRRACDRGGEVS